MDLCKWYFRDATKIQNGRQRSTLKFFVGAKTPKLKKSEIIQILQSHSPRYGDVFFSRFYRNSKLTAMHEIHNNVQVILLKFYMANISRLFKYF